MSLKEAGSQTYDPMMDSPYPLSEDMLLFRQEGEDGEDEPIDPQEEP